MIDRMAKLVMINSVIGERRCRYKCREKYITNADRNTFSNTDRNTLAMINMSDRSARGQEGLSLRIINY